MWLFNSKIPTIIPVGMLSNIVLKENLLLTVIHYSKYKHLVFPLHHWKILRNALSAFIYHNHAIAMQAKILE